MSKPNAIEVEVLRDGIIIHVLEGSFTDKLFLRWSEIEAVIAMLTGTFNEHITRKGVNNG